jgi:hypothetical protein
LFEEPFGILNVSKECGNRRRNMFTVLHTEDGVLGMGRSVRGAIDGLDGIVLDHLLQRWVGLRTFRLQRHIGATIRKQITDRNQFDVGMILKLEFKAELAQAMADNSDSNLTVGIGFPHLRFVDVGFRLVKTGNNLSALRQTEDGSPRCGSRRCPGQERSAGIL